MPLLPLLAAAALGAAAPPPPDAVALLARAKAAQGGAAWDGVGSLHLQGTLSQGGLEGTFDSLTDVRGGRWRDAAVLGPLREASGFDGERAWSQDSSGQSRLEEAQGPRVTARTEAYRRAQAWWYPQRHAADVTALGERREHVRAFQVLLITPDGGRAFELWIDAATGLFDRTLEEVEGRLTTTTFSDWRDVGGVRVPFSTVVTRAGEEAKHAQRLTVTRAARDVPAEAAAFARPAPPPPDSGIAGAAAATTVPFAVVNGHIYLDVRLNGRGPYRLLLDTGGVNIVTPAVAKELGLAVAGQLAVHGVGERAEDTALTRIDRVGVGDAFVERQTFLVFALDRMAAVEGVPTQGLIGYEVFRRFTVGIDYAGQRLTLHDPARFRYAGQGAVVPFTFSGHVPQVEGALDGIPGKFDLDTGSRASLDLDAPFVTKHDLARALGAGPERITGWGVGGPTRERIARARALRLGPVEVARPVVGLAGERSGFKSADAAGNVGYGVLSRFTVTFDYARQRVFLEPNARFAQPDRYDGSGLWVNAAADGWDVVDVVPGSPAAEAGLAAGDRLLAVDGKAPRELSLHDLRLRLREAPAGTAVRVRYRRAAAAEREATLVLRDLV